jgi:cyclopropane fatty-acyl-phospholipid synthase-like methyltransferase
MELDADRARREIASFSAPDPGRYPELAGYTRDELYQDCYGGGGLYLAARMARTLNLLPGDVVLDLGCGRGAASIFLARHYGAKVVAADLWTSATFLSQKFAARGFRDRILPLHLDATQELPFADGYFDAIFCMNSFSFFGGSVEFVRRIARHLAPGGRLSIGSEVLSAEFTPEQMKDPPHPFAFRLPPPNEHVDVFADDFCKQHTASWWRDLLVGAGGFKVEACEELDDADALYQELVRYEFDNELDPFDVAICLEQMEWGRTHEPRKSLFVLTAQTV